MSIIIGELPNYRVYRKLKTKSELVIFNQSYSEKVERFIELFGVRKRQSDKEITVTDGNKKRDRKFPLFVFSTKEFIKVNDFLVELDLKNDLEPMEYIRDLRLRMIV
jgi:hypothetical protein